MRGRVTERRDPGLSTVSEHDAHHERDAAGFSEDEEGDGESAVRRARAGIATRHAAAAVKLLEQPPRAVDNFLRDVLVVDEGRRETKATI